MSQAAVDIRQKAEGSIKEMHKIRGFTSVMEKEYKKMFDIGRATGDKKTSLKTLIPIEEDLKIFIEWANLLKIDEDKYIEQLKDFYNRAANSLKEYQDQFGAIRDDLKPEQKAKVKIYLNVEKDVNKEIKRVIDDRKEIEKKNYDELIKIRKENEENYIQIDKNINDKTKNSLIIRANYFDYEKTLYENNRLARKDYIGYLNKNIDELSSVLGRYPDILKNLKQFGIGDWLNAEVDRLNAIQDPLANNLVQIVTLYDKFQKESNKSSLKFQAISIGMETFIKATNEILTNGFSLEGFKSAGSILAEGLKLILNELITYLETLMGVYSAKALIEGLISGGFSLLTEIPGVIAATAALETARALVNGWNPKFEQGGGVIGSRSGILANIGENYKTELIMTPETAGKELRQVLKNELQLISSPRQVIYVEVGLKGNSKIKGNDIVTSYDMTKSEKYDRTW
jgi:hypothetical protein